ncbi:hypothetical protein [Pseudonocardia yuanmonensis]|uniref:hypothetical protein n=1 Tax=Pseudonocardia yuanmonensis TaxID=1095914 RepID=UPI0031E7E591
MRPSAGRSAVRGRRALLRAGALGGRLGAPGPWVLARVLGGALLGPLLGARLGALLTVLLTVLVPLPGLGVPPLPPARRRVRLDLVQLALELEQVGTPAGVVGHHAPRLVPAGAQSGMLRVRAPLRPLLLRPVLVVGGLPLGALGVLRPPLPDVAAHGTVGVLVGPGVTHGCRR